MVTSKKESLLVPRDTMEHQNAEYCDANLGGTEYLNMPCFVGSHQVRFPMCTLETLQKYCSTGSLLLTFC